MIPVWLVQLIAGAIITAVFCGVGWLINEFIKTYKENQVAFTESIVELTEAINRLNTKNASTQAVCKIRHEILDEWKHKVEQKLGL